MTYQVENTCLDRTGVGHVPAQAKAETDHKFASAEAVVGGFELRCSCSWRSTVVPSAVDLLDEWVKHCRLIGSG